MKSFIEMTTEMISDNYEALNEFCFIQRQRLIHAQGEGNVNRIAFLSKQVKLIEAVLAHFREHLTVKE